MLVGGEDVTEAIRSPDVTSHASQVSAIRKVREVLVSRQRAWVEQHGGSAVVEGRDIGTVVFPGALVKVFLTADSAVGAKRVFGDHRRKRGGTEGEFGSAEDLELAHRQRMHSDNLRYQRHYGIRDCYDPRHFDLVIDTTDLGADDVVERVLAHLKAVEAKEHA